MDPNSINPQPQSPAPAAPAAATPPRPRFNPLRALFSALGPIIVIGGLGWFVAYSLLWYKPTDRLACSDSIIMQQADIAVHVIRQWAGREGQDYAGCQKP